MFKNGGMEPTLKVKDHNFQRIKKKWEAFCSQFWKNDIQRKIRKRSVLPANTKFGQNTKITTYQLFFGETWKLSFFTLIGKNWIWQMRGCFLQEMNGKQGPVKSQSIHNYCPINNTRMWQGKFQLIFHTILQVTSGFIFETAHLYRY